MMNGFKDAIGHNASLRSTDPESKAMKESVIVVDDDDDDEGSSWIQASEPCTS